MSNNLLGLLGRNKRAREAGGNIQGVGIRDWWPKVAPVKGQSLLTKLHLESHIFNPPSAQESS